MAIDILHRPVDQQAVRWVMRRANHLAEEQPEGTLRQTRHILRERPDIYMRYLEAFAEETERVSEDLDGRTRRTQSDRTDRVEAMSTQVFREMYASLERRTPEDAFLYTYAAVAAYAGILA